MWPHFTGQTTNPDKHIPLTFFWHVVLRKSSCRNCGSSSLIWRIKPTHHLILRSPISSFLLLLNNRCTCFYMDSVPTSLFSISSMLGCCCCQVKDCIGEDVTFIVIQSCMFVNSRSHSALQSTPEYRKPQSVRDKSASPEFAHLNSAVGAKSVESFSTNECVLHVGRREDKTRFAKQSKQNFVTSAKSMLYFP